MQYKNIDWSYLRGAILFFVTSAVFSSSIVAGSGYFERRMKDEYRRSDARFRAISERYLAVDDDEGLIKRYLPQFIDLSKTGVLGKERRLNWIETLQSAGDRIQLPALGYEIKAQRHYAPDFPITMGKYKIFVSEMTLDAQLLHEGDLFGLLDILNERAHGRYSVSECELTRFREISGDPGAGNVTASCTLEWFSIKFADGVEIKL